MRDTGTIAKMTKDEERSEAIPPLPKITGDQPLTILRYSSTSDFLNTSTSFTFVLRLSPAYALWSLGIVVAFVVFLFEKSRKI